MNDATSIQLFHNDQFGDIRALSIDGEPWFVAKDVCDALGIRTDTIRAILDEDEVSTFSQMGSNPNTIGVAPDQRIVENSDMGPSQGGGRSPLIISEPGLYKLVMRSRKPEAKAFQRWVTHDVLPAIRRHGAYATPDTLDRMIVDPEFGIRLLTALRDERERSSRLERENATKAERIATLCEDNARLRPLAEYADTTLDAVGCITITDAARQLKQQDPSIGQRRLFGLLRADGLLCQHSNQATAAAIERGYLRNVQKTYIGSDGNQHLREPYAVVTPKGLRWMVQRYCRQTALT